MKRFALIVKGSVADSGDDPPGITADTNNLVDWLRSNEGGAWELDEIWSLRSPSVETLRDVYIPAAKKADYSLLAFFGHSQADPNDKNEMLLRVNKDEDLKLEEFKAESRISLRLIDGCRKVVPEPYLEGITKTAAAPQIRLDRSRTKHRELFDQTLAKVQPGVATLYATSPGTDAYGTESGGRFTSSLISSAQMWTMIGYRPPRILTVGEAFMEAEHLTRKLEPPQYPQIFKSDKAEEYPFAVITK